MPPKSIQPGTDAGDIGVAAGQLKSVEHGHIAFFRDHLACKGKGRAETTVSPSDYAAQQCAAFWIVEKADHRFGNRAATFAVCVGRANQNVGFGWKWLLFTRNRDTLGWTPETGDEPRCVPRTG